jgi:glycerophosphoryl diester phosphodiesterase
MAAFERAVELGVVFIETDLHLTRDARFVAIHDATLERTTNGAARFLTSRLRNFAGSTTDFGTTGTTWGSVCRRSKTFWNSRASTMWFFISK